MPASPDFAEWIRRWPDLAVPKLLLTIIAWRDLAQLAAQQHKVILNAIDAPGSEAAIAAALAFREKYDDS